MNYFDILDEYTIYKIYKYVHMSKYQDVMFQLLLNRLTKNLILILKRYSQII